MTLRRKTIIIIGLTFVCLASILVVLSLFITREGFTEIETKEILKDVERSVNVIENEISRLDDTARDFAEWDETYEYIRNGNRSYVQANLRNSTFSQLKVNFILLVDASGKIVFGRSFDLKQGGEIPFPEKLRQSLAANPLLTKERKPDRSIAGVMLFPDGPMIVSVCPILTSEGMGPARGTLIMGRSLDYFRIKQLAKMTNLSLLVNRIDDDQLPPDMKEIIASPSPQTPVILKPLNQDIIAGYAFVKDIFEKPVLLLRVDQPRAVHQAGESTLRYLLISLFAGTLVLSLVTILLLEGSVLRRLIRLIGDVKQIALVGQFSKRVRHKGKDELANLAFEINGMLEKLEAAEKFKEETLEARYRAVVEDQTEMICRYEPDGTITFVNHACCRYYGKEKNVLIGSNFLDLLQEGIENFRKRTAGLSPDNPSLTREHRIAAPGQSSRWQQWTDRAIFDGQGRMIEYQSVGRDVTKRKQSEEERIRLVTAIEQASEAIYVTDRQSVIQYVNPAFEALSGYSRSEIVGQHPRILKSGKHSRSFYRNIRDTLARGETWSGRLINCGKNGSFYEVEATASPVRDDSGRIINYVGIHRDITREVKLEAQLRQAQKMEAMGTLAGGIAHDFNNILGAIMGFTEMVLYEIREQDQRRKLESALKACDRAKNLVAQILTFSRQGEQERKPLDINAIIKEATKFLRSSIPSTINISTAIPSSSNTVLADPTQVHQVLMNLCTNAAHAMRETGGELRIGLERVDISPKALFPDPGIRSGEYVRLTVSDTGSGIDPAIVDRIFDPFFTTKEIGEGTGLGLAVVYGIVKSYDGAINVYSEPGKGTTFKVYLPRIDESESSESSAPEPISGGSESILLVDDNEDLVTAGQEMLTSLGYTVTTRTNSLDALEIFCKYPDRFDVVITDMTMPHMRGDELVRELLKVRPDIPIVLCTGFSQIISEEKAAGLGIRQFLMKPFSRRDLATAIRRALGDGARSAQDDLNRSRTFLETRR